MKSPLGEMLPTVESPQWNDIEATELVDSPSLKEGNSLCLQTNHGELALEISEYGVRLFSQPKRTQDYPLLIVDPSAVELDVEVEEQRSVIKALGLEVVITHQPFSMAVQSRDGQRYLNPPSDGHFIRRHRIPPLARTEQGWLFALDLRSNEAMYGLGEKWGGLNKRGQLVRSYNHDALGVNAEISYKNIPFCWSPNGWGVLFNTPSPVLHSVGYAPWSQRSYCALLEDDYLDVFLFVTEPNASDSTVSQRNAGAELIRSYCKLTGFAPMPPAWSGGVVLSKAYYKDSDEILEVAREVRKRKMPCDVITFDGRAWQDTDTRFAFEWSPSRYPNPEHVISQLKQLDFKICVWEYPLISTQHEWFKMFSDNGWLIKDTRTGQAYEYDWDQQAFGRVLTSLPRSGIVDFTHPKAYAFWQDQHKALFDIGVDMIKADFGEQLEDEHMVAFNGEGGKALHNVYAHLYNKCVFEAAERDSPAGAFLFSRAAWIGCQRFNSHWGGDPQADWEGMISNIRGGLSWGLTGGPFYATDVGGFYKDTRDDTLYVRWAQAAVFSAHYRLHGIGEREPWSYSSDAEVAVMKALRLRYRLQTYLMKSISQATDSGLPVQRAMVLAFPQEKQAWAFENQFMFGDDLLVVPCFDPNGNIEFYLPEGQWALFDPDSAGEPTRYEGKNVYQQCLGLADIGVFVRVGTMIPMNEPVQTTAELEMHSNIEYWSAN